MRIVIPTKGRADVIGDKALRLFPDATLCVGASCRVCAQVCGKKAIIEGKK